MTIKRADKIAEELEQLILIGEFANGDRLDEVKLTERFGVSRTPIREALQKLAVSGLIEQIPHRGVYVRQPGPLELLEMFEVMAELEAVCGRLAASRITNEALLKLKEANEKCQNSVDMCDEESYYRHNEQFHHLIYNQCGNSFLEKESLRLHSRLKPFRRIQLQLRGRMQQSMTEHYKILEALEKNHPEHAARELREHVAVQGEKFQHLMSKIANK